MPLRSAILTTALVLLCPAYAAAADQLAGIDAYATAAMEKWRVPAVAMAVVKDGEVVFVRGFGARQAGGRERVDGQTVFRLASISKTFAAASVALLVDEGQLAWDDPVKKHLPEFELRDAYLTEQTSLRDLLSHRVGLETGDILARRGDVPRDVILSRLKFLQPYSPFRGKFKYSNLMYVAAGEAASRVANEPWEDLVTRRLFEPLGMRRTAANFARLRELTKESGNSETNLATPYRLHDGQLQAITTAPQIDAVAPAGSVHSTAEDMAQWLKLWLAEGKIGDRRLLKQATVREMLAMHSAVPIERGDNSNIYAAKFFGWGLGWSVLDYRGRKLHTHAGGSGTFIGFVPEERLGVVVLTNLEFTNLSGMLLYDVLDAYWLASEQAWTRKNWATWLASDEPPEITGDKARAKREQTRGKGTSPSLPLAGFAGRYRCDLYGEIEVELQDGKLLLTLGANPPVKLEPWQRDEFISPSPEADAPWFDWLLKFQTASGKCDAVEIERLGWDEPMPTFQRATR